MLKNRKTLFGLIILVLILVSLPFVVRLAQERQILKSRAEECDPETESCEEPSPTVVPEPSPTPRRMGSDEDGPGGCCSNDAGCDGGTCSISNGFCESDLSCTAPPPTPTDTPTPTSAVALSPTPTSTPTPTPTGQPRPTVTTAPGRGGQSPAPTSAMPQPPSGSTTVCGEQKTWADIYAGLWAAGYRGNWTNSEVIYAYENASCPLGTGSVNICGVNRNWRDVFRGLVTANYPGPWTRPEAQAAFERAACPNATATLAPSGTTTTSTPGSPTPTPTPTTKTAFYRISTVKFEKTDTALEWRPYTDEDEAEPITVSLTFENIPIGADATAFVQFKRDDGEVSRVFAKSIKYIGPNPKISSVKCGYSPTGEGTEVEIIGENFGDRGPLNKVTFNGKNANITSWTPLPTTSGSSASTSSASPAAFRAGSLWKVVANIKDKLQGNLPIPVEVKVNDGRSTEAAACTIGLTTVAFNAKPDCKSTGNLAVEGVKVQVKEKAAGAKPIFDQKINLNNEGQPIWSPPALEVGKKYLVGIRAPRALGHKVEIEAKEGTNVLDEFRMLVGDIAPAASLDNRVNALDFGELKRQWTAVKDVINKTGDFNEDKRINSVDYSCMIRNFNKNGEDF